MNLVFVLERSNDLRFFAPIIQEGIARLEKITIWHYPAVEAPLLNLFVGISEIKCLTNRRDIALQIADSENVDYFFFHNPVDVVLSEGEITGDLSKVIDGKWCWFMSPFDLFFNLRNNPAFVSQRTNIQQKQICFTYTPRMLKKMEDWYNTYCDTKAKRAAQRAFSESTIVIPCGFPLTERPLNFPSREEILAKYGFKADDELLIYLPFPFRLSATKGLAWQMQFSGIFSRSELGAGNGLFRSVKSLFREYYRRMRLIFRAMLQKERRTFFQFRPTEVDVARTIRMFCDSNNLKMVIKARTKHPPPLSVSRMSDCYIDDDESQQYPTKLQELLAVASAQIGYSSSAVLESISAGVCHVNIELPIEFYEMDQSWADLLGTEIGGLLNYPNVVTNLSVARFVSDFGQMNFRDISFDTNARTEYLEQFCSSEPASSGQIILNELEKRKML
jgi:hypothetical protein